MRFYGITLTIAAAMVAVVDACVALRLRCVELDSCDVAPAVVPELTRLIAAGALRELVVDHWGGVELFDETDESTRLFVAAVRASAMTKLRFDRTVRVPEPVASSVALVNARSQSAPSATDSLYLRLR